MEGSDFLIPQSYQGSRAWVREVIKNPMITKVELQSSCMEIEPSRRSAMSNPLVGGHDIRLEFHRNSQACTLDRSNQFPSSNPIENLWRELKIRVMARRPANLKHLELIINCLNTSEHMQNVGQ
ncbi:hypothetical protein XENORESO_009608 [Xenotaenia resolanae]|uniref:Tc1-like transposase DDE domain-containing protein n=1 Tax=Xenotaenia resolanae TaxID=208358 RepID=A0ABV0WBF4_9TELE